MPSDNEEFQVNQVWATSTPVDHTVDLTVPSGQKCRAKRLGLEGIIATGVLGDADTLTGYVDKKHINKTKDGEKLNVASIMKDPRALDDLLSLVDKTVPHIVVEPKVHPVPAKLEDREDGTVYVDMVGLEDKMFLFQWSVGGTGDIEAFRSQSADTVAGVGDVEGLPRAARRAAGNRGKRKA
jgi:hypothetical protein